PPTSRPSRASSAPAEAVASVALDPRALAALLAPAPAPSPVFVAELVASPSLVEALLAEKLLEALVTATSGAAAAQPGIVAETPCGPVTLLTARALPPGTARALRPAAEPGRVQVTVVTARADAPEPAAPPSRAEAVAIDLAPRLPARVVGP